MKHVVMLSLALLLTGTHSQQDATTAVPVKAPAFKLADSGNTLSQLRAAALNRCTLKFYLKGGMTNQEANDAIDAGYQRFFSCIRSGGLPR